MLKCRTSFFVIGLACCGSLLVAKIASSQRELGGFEIPLGILIKATPFSPDRGWPMIWQAVSEEMKEGRITNYQTRYEFISDGTMALTVCIHVFPGEARDRLFAKIQRDLSDEGLEPPEFEMSVNNGCGW